MFLMMGNVIVSFKEIFFKSIVFKNAIMKSLTRALIKLQYIILLQTEIFESASVVKNQRTLPCTIYFKISYYFLKNIASNANIDQHQ